jgi:hypothetical protein
MSASASYGHVPALALVRVVPVIVLDRKGDSFTLQYRDYPHLPKFVRHRSGIALMYPPTDEANAAAHSEQA